MSGGSHEYAYSKVQMIAEEYGDLHDSKISEGDGYLTVLARQEHVAEQVLTKHPLRVALARFMENDLAEVLRTIEWSDSGDKHPDEWIEETVAFLDKHGIEYAEAWEDTHAAIVAEQKLDSDEAFAERHNAILAAKGLDHPQLIATHAPLV